MEDARCTSRRKLATHILWIAAGLVSLAVVGLGPSAAQPPAVPPPPPAIVPLPDGEPFIAEPLPPFPADVQTVPGAAGTTTTAIPTGPKLELIDFREMPLGEAMRILSDQSGLKIVPSSAAGQTVISLYLSDVDALTAIDNLTKTNGLYYRQDRVNGIIRIYTTEEYQADLGSFREERTEVFTLLYPNPVDVALAIQGLFGSRVILNTGSLFAGDSLLAQDLQQRFSRFSLLSAFNQLANNTNQGNGQGGGGQFGGGIGQGGGQFGGGGGFGQQGFGGGQFGGGGGQFGGGFGTNNGILGGFGNANQQANQLGQQTIESAQPLGELTPEQIQQLVDAQQNTTPEGEAAINELLRTRQAPIYVTVIRRNNQIVIRTGDEQTMERIRALIRELDVPTPLVLLEVKVMSLDLGDRFTSVFDYQFTDASTVAAGFTAGNILAPVLDPVGDTVRRDSQVGIGITPSLAGSDRDFTFQYVNAHFRARVQLLEDNNRVTNLATPLLLTANNEVSQIFIGQQIPLVVGYSQGGAANNVGGNVVVQPSPQTQLTQVGQGLLITPNINADRTVTLRVSQQNSDVINNGAVIPIINAAGIIVNLPIDVLNTSVVNGTVVAQDGLAVAIGGIINESLTDARQEIPIIGKIPVLGFFFRRQQTNRTRTELVIMIRPYVFNTPSESAALSRDLMQNLSLHPTSPDAEGTLNSFTPPEILRATPPNSKLQQVFRFHSLVPKTY